MSGTELLFTVDKNNHPVDPLPRSKVHAEKLWHRTVGVWITNGQGSVLCEKRSMSKDTRPGAQQAYLGEHLCPGEQPAAGAVRAVIEEIGLSIDQAELVAYGPYQRSDKATHKEFQRVYALKITDPPESFDFDPDEIESVSWITIDELREILLDKTRYGWVHKPWDEPVLDWLENL